MEAVRSLESAGLALQPHPSVERGLSRLAGLRFDKNKEQRRNFSNLNDLRLSLDSWEERAGACLVANPKLGLTDVERLVTEGEALSSSLPSLDRLKEACRKAREWWVKAEALQKPENYPYLDTLEALVARGRPLPVRLDPLQHLETQV